MAVVIKKKALTITSLVTRLFDSEDMSIVDLMKKAEELEATGHSLLVSPTTFSIAAAGNANVLSYVPLKNETVALAMKKQVGHTVKVVIKGKVIDLINTSYQKFLDMNLVISVTNHTPVKPTALECYYAVMQKYHANGGGNKVAAIKELRNLMGIKFVSLKEAKDQVEAWIASEDAAAGELPIAGEGHPETHDFTKVMEDMKLTQQTVYNVELDLKAAPVLLRSATKLNQPVCGTSGGSIYHVIAIGADCVVAARIRANNEIAIRAEILAHPNSTAGQNAKSGLIFAGLDKKNGGHYSLHLDPEDFAMVKRSIGSTIMAMSIPFWGVSTNLHLLQGVGK